jgi:hypothetical protein
MKIGDIVGVKKSFLAAAAAIDPGLGIVLQVDRDYYKINWDGLTQDRITVSWSTGQISWEPSNYLQITRDS